MKKTAISPARLILYVSIFISAANNHALWTGLTDRLDLFSLQGGGFILAFYSLMVTLLFLLMMLFAHHLLLKPVLVFFTVLSAVLSYFTGELGVIFNEEMLMNVAETIRDNNRHEAMELMSLPMLKHIFLLGILPSIAIMLVRVAPESWHKALARKLGYVASVLAFTLVLVFLNFKYITYFSRENRDLRIYVTPIFALFSLDRFIAHEIKARNYRFETLGVDAVQAKPYHRKTVGFMVVGETARADHFSLNGYAIETNPQLKKQQVLNFSNTSSCGTSTAFSVPCMFSFMGQKSFSPNEAAQFSNVLDVINHAGVKVYWVDNNSSCKNVCNRIDNINLKKNPDKNSPFYHDGEYYDEIMLQGLEDYIDKTDGDVLIVLHGMGSHGPTYYKRYPESFAQFKPYCRKNSPQECNLQEITNAYDNTILYTDYFLGKSVDFLKKHADKYESFMVYVSDHGESLGENGIYLHGLPYMLAPQAQTHIPLIVWQSDEYLSNNHILGEGLSRLSGNAYSHDNIPHTLLGFFNIETSLYKPELDIFNTSSAAKTTTQPAMAP